MNAKSFARAAATALITLVVAPSLGGCSDDAGTSTSSGSPTPGPGTALDSGKELRVAVPGTGRVYVSLANAAVVDLGGDVTVAKASKGWDLAFEGLDVFTNSGPSGSGNASGFGPLDAVAFISDTAPATPFLTSDKPGGAFIDWYKYEGDAAHVLWSRYHVFGVKDGARIWKVQVLSYYGDRNGAPVSGIYSIRFAEVLADGTSGATQELKDLDGVAGGTAGGASAPSECLDLGTGARTMLAPAEQLTSNAWHLCFRRQSIIVNGEMGGARGVGAVDLDAAATKDETVEAVKARTADAEKAKFDAVNDASFAGKTFRGDRVVSVFGDLWIDPAKTPLAPAYAAWVVLGADGVQKFLVGFKTFENPTPTTPGTIVLRVKTVR